MDDDRKLRDLIIGKLMEARGKLPTSAVGRLGRGALTGLRAGRVIRRLRGRLALEGADPALGVDPETLFRIVSTVGELKGVGMKVGQLMSYIDVDVPEELREALSALQAHAQPMGPNEARGIVELELGSRGRELASSMTGTPVAAASIGQVHRARLPDGTEVAVKVQYPGIERAIETDFGPASMASHMASVLVPGANVDGFIREAKTRFLEECDYLHEARLQSRFAGIYRDDAVLVIPAVHHDYCSRRVLTTTYVDGTDFETFLASDPPREARDRLGTALFGFYVGSLFRHRLYNCDPHPGNYLFLRDGRIAMLDHGCTREFEQPFIDKIAALTRAVQADDRALMHRAFLDFGMVRDGKDYDFDTARSLVRRFYGPMLEDRETSIDLGAGASMREIALRKREMLRLSLPGEFLFLFRIRLGLMAVLARMQARANWFRLERGFMGCPTP